MEFAVDAYDSIWSRPSHKLNFLDAKRLIKEIFNERFSGKRWIHWESEGGIICLREIFFDVQLQDNAVCLRLGAADVCEVQFKPLPSSTLGSVDVMACFLLFNGTIHTVKLVATTPEKSLLESLVYSKEGGLVNIGIGTAFHPTESTLSSVAFSGVLEHIPEHKSIICASWVAHNLLVAGLTEGDVLVARIQNGKLQESYLRDRSGAAGGLRSIWSGLVQTYQSVVARTREPDAMAVATVSVPDSNAQMNNLAVAAYSNGLLCFWNIDAKQCIQRADVADMCMRRGLLLTPSHQQQGHGGDAHASAASSMLVDSCVVRAVRDAILSSNRESHVIVAAGFTFNPLQQQYVPGASQAHQARTQVLLFASVSTATEVSPSTMRLVAQPVEFPLQQIEEKYPSTLYQAAVALTDVRTDMDVARDELVVLSQWTVTVTDKSDSDAAAVRFQQFGRSRVSLALLRSFDYFANEEIRVEQLPALGMELLHSSSAIRRETYQLEDRIMLDHIEAKHFGAGAAASASITEAFAKSVQILMLQRLFLPGRYSTHLLVAAYEKVSGTSISPLLERFRQRTETLAVDGMTPTQREASHYDLSEIATILPQLIMELCAALADEHLKEIIAAESAFPTDHEKGKQRGVALAHAYLDFMRTCEMAAADAGVSSAGSMQLLKSTLSNDESLFQAIVGRKDGALSLIRYPGQPAASDALSQVQRQQASEIQSILTRHLDPARNPEAAALFEEIDCEVQRYLQETADISAASTEWIATLLQRGQKSLKTSWSDIVPFFDGVVVTQRDQAIPVLDALVQSCSLESLFQEGETTYGASAKFQLAGQMGSQILLSYLEVLLRKQLTQCKLVLTLLLVLQEAGPGVLQSQVLLAVKTRYYPQVLTLYLRYALLWWLRCIRPTLSSFLTYQIEISSLFPLSHLLAKPIAGDTDLDAAAVDCSHSVLANFVVSALSGVRSTPDISGSADPVESPLPHAEYFQWSVFIQALWSMMDLSATGRFTCYLLRAGQYHVLVRWSSLLVMQDNWARHLTSNGAVDLLCFRVQSLHSVSCYLEGIRKVSLALANHRDAHSAVSAAVAAGERLLANAVCFSTDSSALEADVLTMFTSGGTDNHVFQRSEDAMDTVDDPTGVDPALGSFYLEEFRDAVAQRIHASRGEESVRLCADTLHRAYEHPLFQIYFQLLFKKLQAVTPDAAMAATVKHLCEHQEGLLQVIFKLCYLQDTVEIVSRSQSLLVYEREGLDTAGDGLALTIHFARATIETVEGLLDAVTRVDDTANAVQHLFKQRLLHELYSAWSTVFEYALLDKSYLRCNEALEALIEIIRMQSSYCGLLQKKIPWTECLRALIVHACDVGQLHWLYDLPNLYFDNGDNLYESIRREMELLAISSEVSKYAQFQPAAAVATAPHAAGTVACVPNYYEALYSYCVIRHHLRDAARVMYWLLERICLEISPKRVSAAHIESYILRVLSMISSALSLLPENQQSFTVRNTSLMDATGLCIVDASHIRFLLAFFTAIHDSGVYTIYGAEVRAASSMEDILLLLCRAGCKTATVTLAAAADDLAASPFAAEKDSNPWYALLQTKLWRNPVVQDFHSSLSNCKLLFVESVVMYYAQQCTMRLPAEKRKATPAQDPATMQQEEQEEEEEEEVDEEHGMFSSSTSIYPDDGNFYDPHAEMQALKAEADITLNSPYCFAASNAPSRAVATNYTRAHRMWRFLHDTVIHFDSLHGNARLHELALRVMLSKSATAPIPQSFFESYGNITSVGADKQVIDQTNATKLIQTLIRFDRLEDACHFALVVIRAAQAQLHRPLRDISPSNETHHISKASALLPYTILDKLFVACGGSASEEVRQRGAEVRKALEGYFERLVVEHGVN